MVINTLGILEICYIFVFSHSDINFKNLTTKFIKKSDNQTLEDKETVIEPIKENQENK
jgi:hypothetical protein